MQALSTSGTRHSYHIQLTPTDKQVQLLRRATVHQIHLLSLWYGRCLHGQGNGVAATRIHHRHVIAFQPRLCTGEQAGAANPRSSPLRSVIKSSSFLSQP